MQRAPTPTTVSPWDSSLVARTLLELLGVFAIASTATALFRHQLIPMGEWFMDRLGFMGMALGSFLSDAIHFPIPPQFYMLASIAGGEGHIGAFAMICMGAMLGDLVAFFLGSKFSEVRWIQKWMSRTRPWVESLIQRYGPWVMAFGCISPVSYSSFCNILGMFHVPKRWLWIIIPLRVPRLLLFYLAIRMGWGLVS